MRHGKAVTPSKEGKAQGTGNDGADTVCKTRKGDIIMKLKERVVAGLTACVRWDDEDSPRCDECPYEEETGCANQLKKDALELLTSMLPAVATPHRSAPF